MAKEEVKEKKQKKTTVTKDKKTNKKVVSKSEKPKETKNKEQNKIESKKEKGHFIKDVKAELKKVRWPLKKEMITYSIATLVFILILGIFFVATDLIIAGIRMLFI